MNTPHPLADQRIDRILQALATAESPFGLEDRIKARIARVASAPEPPPSPTFFHTLAALLASNPSFTATAAALTLLAAGFLAFVSHPRQPLLATRQPQPTLAVQPQPQPIAIARTHPPAGPEDSTNRSTTLAASPFPAASDDPDTLALAETLAPSHPAPPLPLTAQEALLLRSTRPGQPIEVAELDTLHESALSHLAALRERAALQQYVHGLLGPLAAAQVLTPSSTPPNEVAPVSNTEPSSLR